MAEETLSFPWWLWQLVGCSLWKAGAEAGDGSARGGSSGAEEKRVDFQGFANGLNAVKAPQSQS